MFKKWLICTFLIIYSFTFGYSEQVVVSQFDIGLKNSNTSGHDYKYSLTGVTKSGKIRAVTSTDLSTVIDFKGSFGAEFEGEQSNLSYASSGQKSIIISMNRNSSSTTTTGAFQLTEATTVSGESALTYLIQDNITLPAKTISLSQDTTVSTGVKFTYADSAKALHLSAYKMQKFMIRIAKSSISDTNYDIVAKSNGIQLANSTNILNGTSYAQSFLDGNTGYIDFLVTADQYDKAQSISTDVGLSLKFMPEDIEVLGLPKGNYRIELYSFRYSKEVTTKGNVVITKEDNESFLIGNTEFLENGIDIMNFSSSEFTKIKATILTVGNTTSPSIVVSEDGIVMTANITATSGAIYVDSTSSGALGISAGGTSFGGKYYQLWDVVYTTPNSTINTAARQVGYKMNTVYEARTNYNVISSTAQYTDDPLYQTVFAGFKDTSFSIGTFEIDDRTVNKYSDGYRSVRTANVSLTGTAIDMTTLYKGNASSYAAMSSTISPYNWTGSTATEGNSLIISKVMSDSKGTFQSINDKSKNFTFYTTNWTPNLTYKESGAVMNPTSGGIQATDTVNFSWDSPQRTSYNTTISEDKVIFRMVKSTTNSEDYRYKPESNSNPIIESSSSNLTNFLAGTNSVNYFDVIFKSGEDSEQVIGDTVFTFSKDNNLKIVGLEAGKTFKLQIYSLQSEDTTAQLDSNYDYKILTYGGTLKKETGEEDTFTVGWPILITGTFKNKNNFYVIDSIKVNSALKNNNPNKEIELGVILKTSKQIPVSGALDFTNLKARKDEIATTSSLYYGNNNFRMAEAYNPNYTKSGIYYDEVKPIEAVTVTSTGITVAKSTKQDFHYPLDIIICADASGSMAGKLASVRAGMTSAVAKLEAMGYDVKFNVISLEAPQDAWLLNGLNTDGSRIKFVPETTDGKDDFAVGSSTGYGQGVIDGAIRYDKFDYTDTSWSTYKSSHIVDVPSPAKKMNYQENNFDQFNNTGTKMSAGGIDANAKTVREKTAYTNIYNILQNKDFQTSSGRLIRNGEYYLTVYKGNDSGTGNGWFSDTATAMKAIEQVGANGARGSSAYYDGVSGTQGNGAWALHYAIKRLVAYGREINTLGQIVTDPLQKNSSNIPSEKWIIIAADEDMDAGPRIGKIGYTKGNVIQKIADQAIANNIKLTIMHRPNDTPTASCVGYSAFDTYKATTSGSSLELSSWIFTGNAQTTTVQKTGGSTVSIADGITSDAEDMGWIQRWNIKYTSPFPKSDGINREAIFAIEGLTNYTNGQALKSEIISGTRIYNVPTQKIDAYFINPSDTIGDSNYHKLEKTTSGITLKAKAQSQYKKTIDGVNQWVNYPITKGTFVLTGIKSNDGVVGTESVSMTVSSDAMNEYGKVSLEDKAENSSIWYYATSTLSTSKFNTKFGKNPKKLTITFIAETAEESKQISLSGVSVVDKIAPKITAITMTNITLANLMRELKSDSVTRAFTDEAVTSAAVRVQNQTEAENATGTGIAALSTDSALNVKTGDSVEIGVVIDDESITYTSGTVQIGYGNAADNFTTATCVSVNITSDSAISTWKATIPIVNSATAQDEIVKNITYKVIDGSSSPNTRIVSGNAFNQPALLDNVSLEPNSSNPAGSEYSNYYTLTANQISSNDKTNGALVNIQNEVANTLGYIVVFNYNTVNIDAGDPTKTYGNHSTNTNLKYVAIGNSDFPTIMDGKFRFGAGEYTYNGTVYVINSAGAIKAITSSTVNSLDNIINGIGVGTARFYVDTIAPVVKSIQLEKTADVNSELNSPSLPETNSLYNIIHGIIGETVTVTGGTDYKRPFKAGDNLSLIGTIIEKNIAKSLIGGANIFTDNNLGIITGTESYSKTGIAKDLGEQINQLRDVIIYDKAGNKAIYLTDKTTSELTTNKIQLEIVYDDRTPNNLETKASIVNGVDIVGSVDEVSTKFTKEPTLPLTSTENGVPLSLVIVDSNIYGDVRKGTGTLGSFGYSITTDKLYEPIITTYSYSGIKGETVEDRIILDTVVGSLDSSVNLKSTVANITVANLNDIFNGIFEMVGLSKYSIDTNSTEVSGIQLGGVDYTKGTLRVLTGAPYYQVASKPNPANIIGGSNFTFNVPSGGSYTFIITVYDRLGNFKNISYSVEIPNNVNIIGKKSGISKVISTKVNNSTKKMKIQSRTE